MSDWESSTFRPVSDNSSYFDKISSKREIELRAQITKEIEKKANDVIHNIVLAKDAEISKLRDTAKSDKEIIKLKETIKTKQKEIDSLKREKRHFVIPETPLNLEEPSVIAECNDIDNYTDSLLKIIKYGKSEVGYNSVKLEHIRKIIFIWKKFLEEYKWKSNYISVKIKKLLKDTENILNS